MITAAEAKKLVMESEATVKRYLERLDEVIRIEAGNGKRVLYPQSHSRCMDRSTRSTQGPIAPPQC